MWDLLQTYPTTQLLTFMAAGLALNLTPGADVMFAGLAARLVWE